MIIYGTRSTAIATEDTVAKCYTCDSQYTTKVKVFQRYAHIFWVPVFPIGKLGLSQCTSCNQILERSNFDGTLGEAYETAKANSKTPLWTFVGLAIIAAIIAFSIISSKQNDAKNAQIILAPQKGDVFEVKTENQQYTLYKVTNVIGDSVVLLIHQYETDQATGLSKLKAKGDEGFGKEEYVVAKKDLKNMFDKGEILDINR